MGILLGVSGLAGVGKDTAANFLVKEFDFVKISFADPLKRIARDVFDFTEQQLWGPSEYRNKPDKRYPRNHSYPPGIKMNSKGVLTTPVCLCCGWDPGSLVRNESESPQCYLTPRYALQKLGTEWGRDCYENVWIEYGLRLSKTILDSPTKFDYTNKLGCYPSDRSANPVQGIVIADCRFKNEIETMQAKGGRMLRLKRPGAGLLGSAGTHASELEQQSILDSAFNFVIDNDGTIEDLGKRMADVFDDLTNDMVSGDQAVS
jgi:hypothetical protein